MARRVPKKFFEPLKVGEKQTLGERLKWLRAHEKPYMTQVQLAHRARVHVDMIRAIESDKRTNIQFKTLHKIAHAMGCYLFVNIRSKPYPNSLECQLSGPELPALPKRTGKTSAQGRVQVLSIYNSHGRNYRRRKRPSPRKETSDTAETPVEPSE